MKIDELTKIIVADVDDTISRTHDRDYANAVPIKNVIDRLNHLYDTGWKIVYNTARGQLQFNGDIDLIEKNNRHVLERWMDDNGVKRHELHFGKPWGHYYLDDKAVTKEQFLTDDMGDSPISRYIEAIKSLNCTTTTVALGDAKRFIAQRRGRVAVVGIGKSAHIGRKISATLSSLGVASYFMHGTEASHGDLGMVSDDDVGIVLSASGNTHELGDAVERLVGRYVGITQVADSMVGRNSAVNIIIPMESELHRCNAPMYSTTMMLIVGDLLAHSLSAGLTADEFKKNHPGGKLGGRAI